MKLWLLRPVKQLPENDNPWEPWYDKCFGFVIRAGTEQRAREIADSKAGDENRGEFMGREIAHTSNPWLDSKYSTCTELIATGAEEMIIEDVWSA